MKLFCFAAALVVFTAGCASTGAPTDDQATRPRPADTDTDILHAPDAAASRLPRLTVGVGYSDTQLILPWFLNDIIDFVNYR